MIEIMRTNDPVILSFVESLMKDAGIACMIADQNMSIVEGSIGILARRVLVDSERVDQAKRIVRDAGIGAEIRES